MKRRYTFPATEQGATRFWLCFQALSTRGGADERAKQSKEIHRSESKILRALKAISVPHPEGKAPALGSPDSRMYVLRPEGGTIELEQADFKRLQEYVESNPWAAALTDSVIDLEDSLDADAEKIE